MGRFLAPAAAGLLACLAPSVAWGRTTLPGPIGDAFCTKPPELEHVTGHLLFGYTVTPQGRVADARLLYSSIESAKESAALAASIRACLERWRFNPGTRDGQPVAMPQMVPFHFFRPPPPGDPPVDIPGGRRLGRSRLQEMDDEKLKLAADLLAGATYTEIEGDGWELETDVGSRAAKEIQRALEFARAAFDATFAGAAPLPAGRPVRILLFRETREFDEVVSFDNLLPESLSGAGRYSPLDQTIYAAVGAKPPAIVTGVLVHEATHHLIQMRLCGGRESIPGWIHEGIASFIESVKVRGKGGVDLAAFERGEVSGGGFTWTRPAEAYLRALKDASRTRTLPDLRPLLDGDMDEDFLRGGGDRLYGTSWLLVHYLVNADGGSHRERFRKWLLEDGCGGGAAGLAAAIGRTPEELGGDLRAYLAGIK